MKQMRRFPLLTAVAAALAMLQSTATLHAQYRISDDGHFNDANNRIGSGGYNGDRSTFSASAGTASNLINNNAINDAIISGNVTGLKYFHGPAPSDINTLQIDPGSSQTDRFLAISAPTDITQRNTGANNAVPFYTANKLATPIPAGSVITSTGSVLPSNLAGSENPYTTPSGNITNSNMNNNGSNPYNPLPAPGELDLPGPVDASGNPSSLVASPLYGMRQWSPTDSSDAYFMSRYTNVAPNSPLQQTASNSQIQQMRAELNNTVVPNNNAGNGNSPLGTNSNLAANNGLVNNTGAAIASPNSNLAQSPQINSQLNGAVSSSAVANQPFNNNLANSPLGANSNYTPGTRQQLLVLVPPDQQSAQLKDLEQRIASNRQQMTPAEAAQVYNAEQKYNNESKDNALKSTPGGNAPSAPGVGQAPLPGGAGGMLNTAPPGSLKPANVTPPPVNPMLNTPLPAAGDNKAYIITSLATGIKAKGLADVLTTAEAQMRDGKFSTALNTYDVAHQVAPNNPFATLGRAFAELGGASYGRAEQDLRQSFSMENGAVLLGQYDLRGFLGEDRLKFIIKDLKEINAKEKNERSAFLLAYIAHNVGDDENAALLLNQAEQRAGGNDPTIALMRESWQLK